LFAACFGTWYFRISILQTNIKPWTVCVYSVWTLVAGGRHVSSQQHNIGHHHHTVAASPLHLCTDMLVSMYRQVELQQQRYRRWCQTATVCRQQSSSRSSAELHRRVECRRMYIRRQVGDMTEWSIRNVVKIYSYVGCVHGWTQSFAVDCHGLFYSPCWQTGWWFVIISADRNKTTVKPKIFACSLFQDLSKFVKVTGCKYSMFSK